MLALLAAACFLSAPAPALHPAAAIQPGDLDGAWWIWGAWADELDRPDDERCIFRREFELDGEPSRAELALSVDNESIVRVNGERVGRTSKWERATTLDVTASLQPGVNRIEIQARNSGGPAGLICELVAVGANGAEQRFVSDEQWLTRRAAAPGAGQGIEWAPAHRIGPYGAAPWGLVEIEGAQAPVVDVATRFETPPGFRVEEAWSGLGSYVSLTLDDAGRAFLAQENGQILVLADADGDGRFEDERVFSDAVKGCHGLAYRDGALYCVGKGPDGMGLYRLREEGGAAGEPELLAKLDGSGEHGPHAVEFGPDGALYLAIGNHAALGEDVSPASPYAIHYEGHPIERYRDPRGHAVNVDAPGGTIARTHLTDDGIGAWELVAGGLRNAYDVAFLANGDLFTFDSDMEWDIGMPWYREVRLIHVVDGGEYGWRTGSAKWPNWYPDSLPPACEVGRGSPTGMCVYDGAAFPARYAQSVLAADWSRGRVLAFHLEPDGFSYRATVEELLLGRPLSVSDLAVAADGSLLVATGGRGTEGALWRLVYEGEPELAAGPTFAPRYTAPAEGAGLDEALAALDAEDRFARYLAARALERRGVTVAEAIAAESPRARAEALVVAARHLVGSDDEDARARGARASLTLAEAEANDAAAESTRRVALRALQLFCLAEGRVEDAADENDDGEPNAPREPAPWMAELGAPILALYPTGDRDADRELALLLAQLTPEGSLGALAATLARETSQADGLHLLYAMRALEDGWDAAARGAVTDWFARLTPGGGSSFGGYVDRLRDDLRARFGEHADELPENNKGQAALAKTRVAHGEPWSFDATLSYLVGGQAAERRSVREGARLFAESCSACHVFHGSASPQAVGPELTGAARRFSRRDLLDAIMNPSRVVPEAYRAEDVFLKSGDVVSGIVVADSVEVLMISDSRGAVLELDTADIDERRPSEFSVMPNALLAGWTLEEVADLFAFLEADAPAAAAESSAWTTLFDGGGLERWRFDEALWTIEGGAIVGVGEGLPASSFLISDRTYGDFTLEFDLRVVDGNSGLQFRSTPVGADDEYRLHGYQADAGQVYWGSLYEEGGRGMLNLCAPEVWKPAFRPNGWNHYVVSAIGDRIVLELNGTVTTDLRDTERTEGHLGFQLHAGTTEIWLRSIRIRAED